MKNLFKGYILIYILFAGYNANAQKWEKYIDKYNSYYQKGDYDKALSTNEKFRKKVIKKLGAKNKYVPFVNMNYAKINLQKGELLNVEKNLIEAVEISQEINQNNTSEHSRILLSAIELYLELGSVRLAHDALLSFKEKFAENLDDNTKVKLVLYEIRILKDKGFYNEAVAKARENFQFLAGRTNDRSVKKDERNYRNRQFAELINLVGETFIKKGNYQSADSALKSNTAWIEKNLDKENPEFAMHEVDVAWSTDLQRHPKEAEKLFEDAFNHAKSGRNSYDRFVLKIQEELIKAYARYGKTNRYAAELLEYKKQIDQNYTNKSVFQVYHKLLKIYPDYIGPKKGSGVPDAVAIVNDESILPHFHKSKIDACEYLIAVSKANKIVESDKANLETELDLKKDIYGEDSPEYHLSMVEKGIHLMNFTNDIATAEKVFNGSWEKIVKPEINYNHPQYINIYTQIANFYELTDQYDLAENALDKAFEATTLIYDRNDVDYANIIVRIANLLTTIGEYSKAGKYLNLALDVLYEKRKEDRNIIYYVNGLETKARLYSTMGLYDEAEDILLSSKKLIKKSDIENYDMTVSEEEMAKLYLGMGLYSTALEIINASIAKKEKTFGPDSKALIEPLAVLGRLKLISGEYTDAEKIALKSHNIAENVYGKESSKKIFSLMLLADIYNTIGDYDKAEDNLKTAVNLHLKVFGENHLQLAELYEKLALVQLNKNERLKDVKALFSKSKDILLDELDDQNPLYAELLKDQAFAYIAGKEYSEAFKILKQAEGIWIAKAGKRNNINVASIYMFLGDVYYMLKNYAEAKSQYNKAKNLYEKFFSSSHPEYVKSLAKLSKVEYMTGDVKTAMNLMEKVLINYNEFIKFYFPALSEREKARFWNTIKDDYEFYNTLVLKSITSPDDKLVGKLYDNALQTKALLLNSSIKMRENILNSNDQDLIDKYNSWLESKELLTNVLSMSTEQLLKYHINEDSLVRVVELLEKDLSEKSNLFSVNAEKSRVTWENVKSVLKENEVAIEMIRFRYFDHVFTDSIVYAALTIRNDKKRDRPELILLKEGKNLENKYFKFYKNMIVYRLNDDISYKKFWEPVDEKIGSNATVYLSPDGVYNQINIEAMKIADDKYVLDNSNIILVSNTKDLYLRNLMPRPTNKDKRALMFGDPEFYVSAKPALGKGKPLISDLPGTEKEVESVYDLLEKNGWKADYYLKIEASEDQVKALNNPKVFHIATHGFYTPEEEIAGQLDMNEINEAQAVKNPLLRSGLMLKGAGDVLTKTRYNYNVDSGILTAYEAMNLNLDYTDLVVLSACETGVGDVKAGEGVYGLQRAFLVAGAKMLIMSLFKVSDDATNELMVKFYDKWLSTGEMRSSFIQAKKEIRNEYKDPIYWGSFIMFGLE